MMNELKTMRLVITDNCPLACRHCSVSAGPKRNGLMPVESAKKLIRDFATLGGQRLVVTGGEPLSHPNCKQILRESKSEGLHNSMFSMAIDRLGSPISQLTAYEYALSRTDDSTFSREHMEIT